MKKIIATAAAVLFLATSIFAQAPQGRGDRMPQGTPEENAKRAVAALKSRLSLTDDQAAKLEASYTEFGKQEQALREQQRALDAKREEATKSILTPKQFEKLQKDRKEMMERMRNRAGEGQRGPGRAPGAPGDQQNAGLDE